MATPPIPAALSLVDLRQRINHGFDPQVLLDGVVDAYLANDRYHHPEISNCIVFLAKNGARVATEDPGCALEAIIRKPTRENSDLVDNIARHLAEIPGELPFHVLAQHAPILLSYHVHVHSEPAIQSSLCARDGRGRTVSHYLWHPQSIIVAKHQGVQAAGGDWILQADREKDWSAFVHRAWTAQDRLQNIGIGMDMPDHQGVTAMDLCMQRLEADDIQLLMSFESCKQVKAYQASCSMGTDTPLVETAPLPPGLRF